MRPSTQFLDYPPAVQIPWRELQSHAIPDQHTDEVPARAAGHVRRHQPLALDPHPKQPVRQRLEHCSLDAHRTV